MGEGGDSGSGAKPAPPPGALTALLRAMAADPGPQDAQPVPLVRGALVGRFEIVRELGRGAFGVVHEARDRELGRSVALKIVRPGRASVGEAQLAREAEAVARLSHPNLVTLYEVGRSEHGPYLVFELLLGKTLQERIDDGPLALLEAVHVAVEVARGLAHAHAEGVVHRDLKPSNVFVTNRGQVKILDFGMAHAFGRRRVSGGTPAYMAPEQWEENPEDERTDVFALGVILHRMLAGENPFPEDDGRWSSGPALAPRLQVPGVPELGDLVGRMLEKVPVGRPRDGAEVLAALEPIEAALRARPPVGASAVLSARRRATWGDFVTELKRRHVFRVLAGYGIFAFALLQVTEPIMHGAHLPEWVLSAVVVLLGLGFPLTIGLAWAFDLKATGLERTPPAAAEGGPGQPRGARVAVMLLGLGLVVAVPGIAYHFGWRTGSRRAQEEAAATVNPLADARFQRLTGFDGVEQAAALSRDGRFAAFQSDRDGQMDVWVTQVGTGQFFNLTHGGVAELVNPSIRTLGFSPDGTLVTFWVRRSDAPGRSDISIWATPLLGGEPRPYLDGVAEFDWSADGSQLTYHTAGPGDPMHVSDTGKPSASPAIHAAPPGLHAHFPVWSPDRDHIYFVEGSLPDRMDIWRIRPTGGPPEQITHHDSRVSHPVFLDPRTLLYLATDPDGFGPWIYCVDVLQPAPRRVSFGIDSFTSLAASADGRRLVVTMSNPKGTLWRVPFDGHRAEVAGARRIPLTTGSGSFPRSGPGFLLYVSSKGASDGLWKLRGAAATELWTAPETRIIGAPAISRDGQRIAFAARQAGRTLLYAVNSDGTNARVVTRELELRGSPAWAPDGQSITVAAMADGAPHLFRVASDGGAPTPFAAGHAVDPAWSPEGDLVAFTGADVGTTFPIKAVKADGSSFPLPGLTLTRGARHLSFLPQGRALLVLKGEIGHKDLWRIDLDTGVEHRVTELAAGFELRDFDISRDGREVLLEQVQERSDAVLIERAPR